MVYIFQCFKFQLVTHKTVTNTPIISNHNVSCLFQDEMLFRGVKILNIMRSEGGTYKRSKKLHCSGALRNVICD